MMRTIHKHRVPLGDALIALPLASGAIRYLGIQGDQYFVWAEVTEGGVPTERRFQWYGTGHPIPATAVYVGTIVDAPYVWHLHELPAC